MLTRIIPDSPQPCTWLPGWGFDVNAQSGIEIRPQSYALGPIVVPCTSLTVGLNRSEDQVEGYSLLAGCNNTDRLSVRDNLWGEDASNCLRCGRALYRIG